MPRRSARGSAGVPRRLRHRDASPHTVCGSLGLDTSGYSIPYLASSSEVATLETIEQVAHLIDRLARRIEDAVERGVAGAGETPLAA